MKNKEKELFKNLCSINSEELDKKLLEYATPGVLGHLFFNRMQGMAYGMLQKHGCLGKVNREFRNSLAEAYQNNIERNESFFSCVEYLSKLLENVDCKYALLKGAYLCRLYPKGYRTSNDIDILTLPEDVTIIEDTLKEEGFKQGNIRNGIFEAATRMEIVQSRMMRGETVPYIKEVNLPRMKYLEIDINFSLDYKYGDSKIIAEILDRAKFVDVDGMRVLTLEKYDFFIHLCNHLYKEATTKPWVEMSRDMTLYKYCDIYLLVENMDIQDISLLFTRARSSGMEKQCAYCIYQTSKLFDMKNLYAVDIAEVFLSNTPEYVHTVISPSEKKKYVYKEKDIAKRFFCDKRIKLLEEVMLDESD